MLGGLGGAFSVPMARMGDRLGSMRRSKAAMTSKDWRRKPHTHMPLQRIAERYAREWLSHQAASGHLDHGPVCGAFTLTPEQARVFE